MPVEPPPALGRVVRQPPIAADPPTISDVRNAIQYTCDIEAARAHGVGTMDNCVTAEVYKFKIIQAHTATQQPGLQGVLDQINNRLTSIEGRLNELFITSAQAYNLSCHDGQLRQYLPVRLADGSLPEARGLPRLQRLSDIERLSVKVAREYCQAYSLDLTGNKTGLQLKQLICVHIGCPADF